MSGPLVWSELPAESRGDAPGRGRMAGRRIVVVGGGQTDYQLDEAQPIGNGRAIALLLAREGAAVAVVDRDPESAQATVGLIRSQGGQGEELVADVGDPAAVDAVIQAAHQRLGGLDGLVYNVGVPGPQTFEAASAEAWDAAIDVNLRGAMLSARAALRVAEPRSSFVFVSSIASLRPTGRLIAYEASKAGMGAIMRAVGFEGKDRGMRANAVMLGMIDTGLGRSADGSTPRRDIPIALGRFGTAWESAYAVLFLLSDEAAYVTGQILAVDGGRTTL